MIEAYSFAIEYRDSNSPEKRDFNGIVISGSQDQKMTIKHARNGLDHLVRNLIVLTESLPYLPGMSIPLRDQARLKGDRKALPQPPPLLRR